MLQHLQINHYDTSHYQNEGQISLDHLNIYRKSIWQNSTSVDDKKYSLTDTNTILEFNNKAFENNGYELRFELYDGDRKITTVRQKFITK